METAKIVYKTRFRKCDLAKAIDNKYKAYLINESGRIHSVALRKYIFNHSALIDELAWDLESYRKWRGYIDPKRGEIICKHLDLSIEDFD